MGTFQVTIEVGDTNGARFEPLEAFVDTGATYLAVPSNILGALGIRPIERRPFSLADGTLVEYDVGVVSLRLDSRTFPVVCIFANADSDPLLGAVALEIFMLAAGPVNQVLIPVTGRLM